MDLLAKAMKKGKSERTELELEGDLLGKNKPKKKEPKTIIKKVEKFITTTKLKKSTSDRLNQIIETKKKLNPIKKQKKGRILAFVGDRGTGKTFACADFAQKYKKTLYIDTEYKASEIFDERFPKLKYDMKEPIKDKNKNFSQIFKDSSDVHIDVAQIINETTGKPDAIATVQYIIKTTPLYLELIKSGKYKNFIIDSCSPIWKYAEKTWLKRKGRDRVTQFEWSEVEAIKQDIILPFVNYCKIYNVRLILTFGITGHYVNDIMIGYKEDAKHWLLSIFSYELWFEVDYKKYCIKHPYRPFWSIQDEDMHISEYLFNKEFIDNDTKDKDFEDFKYESMTSESYRKELKTREKSTSLKIGQK